MSFKKLDESLIQRIRNIQKETEIELFSFDIFDTLITRTTQIPIGIFALMQHELIRNQKYFDIPEYVRINFYDIRISADFFVNCTNKRHPDVIKFSADSDKKVATLEDIYNQIAKQQGLNKEMIEKLMQLELDTEYKNILPIWENINIVKYLVEKGYKVVLISDMYLPKAIIKGFLLKFDNIFNDIPIYISGEFGETKSDGGLYTVVKKNESIDIKKWIHIGDNIHGDFNKPKKRGIGAFLYKNPKFAIKDDGFPQSFEKDFCNSPYGELLMGIESNAELFLPDNKLSYYGAVAVNILYPYVKWVIDESIKKGIGKLCFVARDGYILKKIADVIIKEENLSIETLYIYGSRQAWQVPSIDDKEDLEFLLNFICNWRAEGKGLQMCADLLNLKIDELLPFLPEGYKDTKKIYSKTEFMVMVNELKNNSFLDFIKTKNKEQHELLIKYLESLNLQEKKFALVDLCGSGVTNFMLSKMIYKKFNLKSTNFYFCLLSGLNGECCELCGYVYNYLYPIILDCFCRAPHGLTLGYKEENGEILPVTSDDEIMENFKDYEDAVEFCAKLFHNAFKANNILCDTDMHRKYANYFCGKPNKKLVEFFAKISIFEIGNNKKYPSLKSKLSIKDVLDLYYFGNGDSISWIHCAGIARANSSAFIELLIEFFIKFPKLNCLRIKKCIKHSVIVIKNKLF